MGQAFPKPALRPFLPTDVPELAEIFRSSIEDLTENDYSAAQRAAWIARADDEAAFGAKLASELTLVATIAGSPVGFASLEGTDHVDMLFVHPAAARQGIATLLVDALEKLAMARGAMRLSVEASDTARDFFVARGYSPDQRNMRRCGDEWLGNTSMHKQLAPQPQRPV